MKVSVVLLLLFFVLVVMLGMTFAVENSSNDDIKVVKSIDKNKLTGVYTDYLDDDSDSLDKIKITIKAAKVTNKYKKSGNFKITVKYKSNNKVVKNLKLTVKIKTNHKYKTYHVKTGSNGVAYFNTKNLKSGSHKVIITSGNSKFIGKTNSLIKIDKPIVKKTKSSGKSTHSGRGYYVASINSDKFHYPSCSAAKRIKSYNKISFSSRNQAVNNGYYSCGICHP